MSAASRVVVACLDGKRLKGYVFNFSALRDSFRLFPEPNSPQTAGADLQIRDVKAIFFVKDFAGQPERTFLDGEKIPGTSEAYNRNKLGFFMFPSDRDSNNSRIFVVNKNVSAVKLL